MTGMTTEPPLNKKASGMLSREKLEAILADWRTRWPAVFTKAVPLATGTGQCIREQLSEQFSRQDIKIILRYWTRRSSYLRAVARGDTRRHLDGSEADVPTEEMRDSARCVLEERSRRKLEQPSVTP